MQINEIHEFIGFIIEKEEAGYISPEEKDNSLYAASLWLFSNRLKRYAVDQEAQDDLNPFKKRYVFTPSDSPGGLVTLPSDYVHMTAGGTITYDNKQERVHNWGLEAINDDELYERLSSQLDPVTIKKPVFQWAGNKKIQLYPKTPCAGEVWYLKEPVKPKYNYTQVGRDITYVPTGSVQLEWNSLNLNQVIYRALNFMAPRLEFEKMIQYSTMQTQLNP